MPLKWTLAPEPSDSFMDRIPTGKARDLGG